MDEETIHYARVYKAKRARLNVLEEQIAAIGEYNVSPHVAMERNSLTEELAMFEVAIESPARADVSDELGPRGRFVVNYQQNQDIKKNIAALAVQFEQFVATSLEWRTMHRNWIVIIGLVVILILVAVVALVTYLITKGAL
jgi:hypothetical protein